MPTLTMCYCGAEIGYIGAETKALQCAHCDRACHVQKNTKEPCPRCETAKEYWAKKIADIYGPGSAG